MPAIAGARFVVSDNGDILSPKYAPEMIAPAIIPSLIPIAFPIPINANPTVAMVVHELPVANDTKAHTTQDAKSKMVGFNIFNP